MNKAELTIIANLVRESREKYDRVRNKYGEAHRFALEGRA